MFCRICQWAIEKELDDCGSIQRPSLVRHLRRCSKCREFYHRMMQLGQQLRTTASCELSEEQLEKIYFAVGQRLSERVPAQTALTGFWSHTHFRIRYAVSVAAILLVSLVGLYYLQYIGNTKQADPLARFVRNSTEFQGRISFLACVPEQSIQSEIKKLTNDTQDAFRFVANCIPSAPANISDFKMRTETSSQDH